MVQSSTRGRPMSWVVVALVIGGFLVGGIGMIVAALGAGIGWWLFWLGVVVVIVGIAVGWATGIMEDVH